MSFKYTEVVEHWNEIVDDLRITFTQKIDQYGTEMYEGQSANFRFWSAYFNIRRKTLRLERLTELALHHPDGIAASYECRDKLISDYKDIANYAIMAVQILEEKQNGV